ncbi:MAG: IPT/TIG domain-containing protein, partial [Firmicutes bacterium]|nr:IPT/TIG domain-containing protein [Bacillota bacterium]
IGTFALGPPTVVNVSPSSGPAAGGTCVEVTGSNFSPGADVTFGATSAESITFVSASQLDAMSPPGVGTVPVFVDTLTGASDPTASTSFTYTAGSTAVTSDHITACATPATISAGGQTTVAGAVYGPDGVGLAGIPIRLTVSYGSLPACVTTGSNGRFAAQYVAPHSAPANVPAIVTATIARTTESVQTAVTVNPAPLCGLPVDASAQKGRPVNFNLHAVGGVAPYRWLLDGTLPDGVSLSANGVISGVPAAAGTYPFAVTVVDGQGAQSTVQDVLHILDPTVAPTAASSPPPGVAAAIVHPLCIYARVIASRMFGPGGGTWLVLEQGHWVVVTVPARSFSEAVRVSLVTTRGRELRSLIQPGQRLLLPIGLQLAETPKKPIRLTVLGDHQPRTESVSGVSIQGSLTSVHGQSSQDGLSWAVSTGGQWAVVAPLAESPPRLRQTWATVSYPDKSGKEQTVIVPYRVHRNGMNGKWTVYMPAVALDQVLTAMGLPSSWNSPIWTLHTSARVSYAHVRLAAGGTAQLQINGHPIWNIDMLRAQDPLISARGTYAPIWYLLDALRRMGIRANWKDDHLTL